MFFLLGRIIVFIQQNKEKRKINKKKKNAESTAFDAFSGSTLKKITVHAPALNKNNDKKRNRYLRIRYFYKLYLRIIS